ELRPVLGEMLEEMLPCAGAQEEQIRPDAGRAGLAGGLHDLAELLRAIRDPGEDRSHSDACLDPGLHEARDGTQALARMRGGRLGSAPDVFVQSRDRERHGDACTARGLDQHVDVADDHWAARDDAERVARLGEGFDAGAGQAVVALGRLVRVGGGADRDALSGPRGAGKLAAEDLGDVDLDADRRAVAVVRGPVGAELEGPDVTEGAAMDAAQGGGVGADSWATLRRDRRWTTTTIRLVPRPR